MSPAVVRLLIGVVGLGIISAGGYGIYSASQSPSNIKEQLIYESLKIIPFEGGERLWKAKAQAYKSSTDKKIPGLEVTSYESDFTKLRDECKKLFEVSLQDADVKTKLGQAKQWCIDNGSRGVGIPVILPSS